MFKTGDVVIWSRNFSNRVSFEVCRIQKINQHKYSVFFYSEKDGQTMVRSVFKDNICRLARDSERAIFYDRIKECV